MDFYIRYPMLAPYKGRNFGATGQPSLLLVGESHYLSDDIPQRAPDRWYTGDFSTLAEWDIDFISTALLLESSREDQFAHKAHSIWSNSMSVINDNGPRYPDFTRVADDVAFYNFFLRPAVDGGSLQHELCEEDLRYANEAFRLHIETLRPSAVVFLSTLAHSCLQIERVHVPIIATPHPCCAWWNRPAAKYGWKSGREILEEYVKTTSWDSVSLETQELTLTE